MHIQFLRAPRSDQGPSAPGVPPDADDSAKCVLAIKALGGSALTQGLVFNFEGPQHFRTYQHERTASLTTNCNVLLALLSNPDEIGAIVPTIEKVAAYIVSCWFRNPEGMRDKWVNYSYICAYCAPY